MKELNMSDLVLYLISESAIEEDDVINLTVAPQLSKSQVAFNLFQTVKTRHTVPQFLKALKRSSGHNPWHGELYEKMMEEREHRVALQSSAKSKSLNLSKVQNLAHDLFTLPGELESRRSEYKVTDMIETARVDLQLKDLEIDPINTSSPPSHAVMCTSTDTSTLPLTDLNMSDPSNHQTLNVNQTKAEEDNTKSKLYRRWNGYLENHTMHVPIVLTRDRAIMLLCLKVGPIILIFMTNHLLQFCSEMELKCKHH